MRNVVFFDLVLLRVIYGILFWRHCERKRSNPPCWDSLLVDCHARTLCSLAMTRCFASLNMDNEYFLYALFFVIASVSEAI